MGPTEREQEEWHKGYDLAVQHAITRLGQLKADRSGNVKRWDALNAVQSLRDNVTYEG